MPHDESAALDGGPHTSLGRQLAELAMLAALLLGYLLVLGASSHLAPTPESERWWRLIIPNAWFGVGTVLYLRWTPLTQFHFRGGRRARLLSAAMAAMAITVLLTPFVPARMDSQLESYGLPGQALIVVLLVPLVEELFFRGILFDHLLRTLGRTAAILIVSGLFGFLHAAQGMMETMCLVSIALCLIALATGSLLWPMAIHLVWNAMVVVFRAPPGPWRFGVAAIAAATLLALAIYGYRTRMNEHDRSANETPRPTAHPS